MTCGAEFDASMKYRYKLWRGWNLARPKLLWILLNPSTADELKDDPTLKRCIKFSLLWNFGGLEIVNLFAFRSTGPALLAKVDAVGPHNDDHILGAISLAHEIVVGWGNYGDLHGRGKEVIELIRKSGFNKPIRCLGHTRSGNPRHPLYMPYSALPRTFAI